MRVQWYGQSAFALEADEGSIFIDPFGDMSAMVASRGLQFDDPPIESVEADLVLVTHEHGDHNGVEAIVGAPPILRSTAGRLESPFGEVLAIASEHDPVAGTERGPNTIFVFSLGGIRVAHFGDFGQSSLRDEQAHAIGEVDLVFLPVGGGPTLDAAGAHAIVARIRPRWGVPMHYRTPRVNFLESADAFIERSDDARRLDSPAFAPAELAGGDGPVVVVLASP